MPPPQVQFTDFAKLRPKTSAFNFRFIVLEQLRRTRTKEGDDVTVFKVADRSGSIQLCIFGTAGRHLQPGDYGYVLNGTVNVHQGKLTAYVSRSSELRREGDFFLYPFADEPYFSASDYEPPSPVARNTPAPPPRPPPAPNRSGSGGNNVRPSRP